MAKRKCSDSPDLKRHLPGLAAEMELEFENGRGSHGCCGCCWEFKNWIHQENGQSVFGIFEVFTKTSKTVKTWDHLSWAVYLFPGRPFRLWKISISLLSFLERRQCILCKTDKIFLHRLADLWVIFHIILEQSLVPRKWNIFTIQILIYVLPQSTSQAPTIHTLKVRLNTITRSLAFEMSSSPSNGPLQLRWHFHHQKNLCHLVHIIRCIVVIWGAPIGFTVRVGHQETATLLWLSLEALAVLGHPKISQDILGCFKMLQDS
jgi:hypothetical protein